jgi:hypothetical protein
MIFNVSAEAVTSNLLMPYNGCYEMIDVIAMPTYTCKEISESNKVISSWGVFILASSLYYIAWDKSFVYVYMRFVTASSDFACLVRSFCFSPPENNVYKAENT